MSGLNLSPLPSNLSSFSMQYVPVCLVLVVMVVMVVAIMVHMVFSLQSSFLISNGLFIRLLCCVMCVCFVIHSQNKSNISHSLLLSHRKCFVFVCPFVHPFVFHFSRPSKIGFDCVNVTWFRVRFGWKLWNVLHDDISRIAASTMAASMVVVVVAAMATVMQWYDFPLTTLTRW